MTLDDAGRLAASGRGIEARLDKAAQRGEAPRAGPLFQRKIEIGDETVTIELGIAADPAGVYVTWAGKRVAMDVDNCGALLGALARIGEAANDIRRASAGPVELEMADIRRYRSPYDPFDW